MARSARLVVRVVHVPAGPGAADARRRVADVLLRAATASARPEGPNAATPDSPEAPAPQCERDAASDDAHTTDP